MGRAYEVRKASIQKTGAIKAKLYSTFAKEIYLAAKKGTPDIDSNAELKRIVEKAKRQQIPNDIINRAIEKAKGASNDDYQTVIYEGFGPGNSTLIIKTLTDNVNRTVSFVRTAFNKVHKTLGVTNSVAYNYEYLGIVSFKSTDGDNILEELLNTNIELVDFESEDEYITISVNPVNFNVLKDTLEKLIPHIDYEYEEIGMFAKEKITLVGEEKELFDRLYQMLDDIEDVTAIYHNVID